MELLEYHIEYVQPIYSFQSTLSQTSYLHSISILFLPTLTFQCTYSKKSRSLSAVFSGFLLPRRSLPNGFSSSTKVRALSSRSKGRPTTAAILHKLGFLEVKAPHHYLFINIPARRKRVFLSRSDDKDATSTSSFVECDEDGRPIAYIPFQFLMKRAMNI